MTAYGLYSVICQALLISSVEHFDWVFAIAGGFNLRLLSLESGPHIMGFNSHFLTESNSNSVGRTIVEFETCASDISRITLRDKRCVLRHTSIKLYCKSIWTLIIYINIIM